MLSRGRKQKTNIFGVLFAHAIRYSVNSIQSIININMFSAVGNHYEKTLMSQTLF